MMAYLRKYPLLSFFIITNVISWLIWLPLIIDMQSGKTDSQLWWLHYLGGFGPMLGALIMTAIVAGKQGLRDIGTRMAGRGARLRWHLLGFGLPLLFFALVWLYQGLISGNWIDVSLLGQTAKLPGFSLIGILVVEILFFGFGEETGWRGFALPRLQKRFNAFTATAILTLPWAFWHVPTFFYNPNMMAMDIGGIIGWVLSLFTGAIILAWLYNGSRGSILPVALFHGMIDVVFVSDAVAGKLDAGIGMIITFFAIALVFIARPRNLAHIKRHIQA